MEIAIESEGAGRGTTVTLRLPILREANASENAASHASSGTPAPARLLLVNDNRDALQALSLLLELEGHHVITSDNGRDAIALMTQHPPEVVLINVGSQTWMASR